MTHIASIMISAYGSKKKYSAVIYHHISEISRYMYANSYSYLHRDSYPNIYVICAIYNAAVKIYHSVIIK